MYIDAVHRCQNWRRLVIICHQNMVPVQVQAQAAHSAIALQWTSYFVLRSSLCRLQKGTTSETDPFITGDSRPLSHALTFAAKSSLFCWFNSFCFPGFYGVMFEEILRDVFLYLSSWRRSAVSPHPSQVSESVLY